MMVSGCVTSLAAEGVSSEVHLDILLWIHSRLSVHCPHHIEVLEYARDVGHSWHLEVLLSASWHCRGLKALESISSKVELEVLLTISPPLTSGAIELLLPVTIAT